MGEQLITLRGPDGDVIERPVSEVGQLIDKGYRAEGAEQRLSRLGEERREEIYTTPGQVAQTFVERALGAGTLGLYDVGASALGPEDLAYEMGQRRDRNEEAALAGTLAGSIVPGLGGGKLLSAAPGAMASRLGSKIVAAGEGASLGVRAATTAAGAAVEGGLQNAGAYITDVALGDRELSGEGFAGAMGSGAFWGGVAGGALTLGAGGLTAARKLFPKAEISAANVAKVEREAVDGVAASVDDAANMRARAQERLTERRLELASSNPELATKLEEIRISKAREATAKAETASARADIAEETAWKAKARAFKAREEPAPRRAKGTPDGGSPVVPEPVPGVIPDPVPSPAAIAGGVTEDAATLLERQLLGTKAHLDAGETIAQVGARRPAAIGLDDALNAEIAKVDPESARLVRAIEESNQSDTVMQEWLTKYKGGAVAKSERAQATRDYAANMRPKESGYYSSVPEGEGNRVLARGKQSTFRGTEAERDAADAAINAKVNPIERDAIDAAVARRAPRELADEIVSGEAPKASVGEQLQEALGARADDIGEDISDAASTISRHESATAELAEALGERATSQGQAGLQGLRDAERSAATRTEQATLQATEDIDKAISSVSLPGLKAQGRFNIGGAQDAGTAWEALHMMGVPLPDPRDIPVVGPVLSMYLKARVLGKAFGRFGGQVAETAETAIASRAAQTKQRVFAAVDKLLEGGSKALSKAAPKVGGAAAVLAHSLFDDRPVDEKRRPYTSTPKDAGLQASYEARADELGRAMQPGAIRAAVRDRVRASDPGIVDAIVAAKERKLGFLYEKMPKADPPGILAGKSPAVAKLQLQQWAKYIEAAEDPAGVLERAVNGDSISVEAAETLQKVYPSLFQAAQRRLVEQAATLRTTLPFNRRVQLSLLFQLPLESSNEPEYAAFLQESYQPKAAAPPPAMGSPTIAGPVNLGQQADPYSR